MYEKIHELLLVKQEPVNLKHQTIFAIIPCVSFYAFYRVQKLRTYLLILISMYFGIPLVFAGLMLGMIFFDSVPENLSSLLENSFDFLQSYSMYAVIFTAIALINIYLVRRWSKQWNKHLDGSDTNLIPTKEWDD